MVNSLNMMSEEFIFQTQMARSLLFTLEGLSLPLVNFLTDGKRPKFPTDNKELFMASREALVKLLREDSKRIAQGVYPATVLLPENPIDHFARFPAMLLDGLKIARRKKNKDAHEFSSEAQDYLQDMPEYYRRNFHFQSSGYLSESSALLYDHQVQVLFAGCADAMRRMILAPLKNHFEKLGAAKNGRGLSLLEIGSGTGSATRFVRMLFPEARITSIDLSEPYLKQAQKRLAKTRHNDFMQADGAKLPFLDESYDAVYSVFLFHELPADERKRVVRESHRVLKSNGFLGIVDSLQLRDSPELDVALRQFPIEYHEPFYTNYIQSPLDLLLSQEGFTVLEQENGFYSKVIASTK